METQLFVVKVYNEKRDAYTERLVRAATKKSALSLVAEVRKATADDAERLLKRAD